MRHRLALPASIADGEKSDGSAVGVGAPPSFGGECSKPGPFSEVLTFLPFLGFKFIREDRSAIHDSMSFPGRERVGHGSFRSVPSDPTYVTMTEADLKMLALRMPNVRFDRVSR